MATLIAVKSNKVLTIQEAEIKRYQALGFDIVRDGEIIHHGAGKTVPYGKYEAVVKELEALKAKKAPAAK